MHTTRCIDMALMVIAENNAATLYTEPDTSVGDLTPETRIEAEEWLANGNTLCHEPEKCNN